MARPKCCRKVRGIPASTYFKPRGIPLTELEEIVLAEDEFEAIRLADLQGLYHEQAAAKMGVSRQTFGRIIQTARRKISEALVKGKALRVEGGERQKNTKSGFECRECRHRWTPSGKEQVRQRCPSCKGHSIHRITEERCAPGRKKLIPEPEKLKRRVRDNTKIHIQGDE